MEIVSWPFLAFSCVVLFVYYHLGTRAQNIWLLIASYAFYLSWGLYGAVWLAVITIFNYWAAQSIDQQKTGRRTVFVWTGIFINLISLISLKLLSGPYGIPVIRLFGIGDSTSITARILLPVGFSFYALQAIAYLADVAKGRVAASRDPINLALYLAYFPKLLSGPIERAPSFFKQLDQPRFVGNETAAKAITMILVGLFRKVVIADTLSGMMPATIFQQPFEYSTVDRFFWLAAFAFVLYNDFAGYSGIVRGLSGLMGIELSPNFQQPFFARSFTEFWNRWHISLSHWLRDFIFYPTSRILLRRFKGGMSWVALAVPPLITMIASGAWHGLLFSMLFWGGLHGLYQAGEHLTSRIRPQKEHSGASFSFLSAALVFTLTTFAWVPFATNDLSRSFVYWQSLLSPASSGASVSWLAWPFSYMLISLVIDWAQYHSNDEVVFMRWSQPAQVWSVALALLAIIFSLGTGADVSGFVYQGF